MDALSRLLPEQLGLVSFGGPTGSDAVESAIKLAKFNLIEIGGHYDNVARFLPPLVLTDELARKGLEVFADAVEVESSR